MKTTKTPISKTPTKYVDIFGTERWKLSDGTLHREDGPAIVYNDHEVGTREWLQWGMHHREDGPAIEWWTGDEYWYLWGHLLSDDHVEILKDSSLDYDTKMGMLKVLLGIYRED